MAETETKKKTKAKPKTKKKYPKKPTGNPVGRPTAMDEMTLKKLEEGFSFGLPDEQACLYAGISPPTLYAYQEKNPGFLKRKNELKQTVTMHARLRMAKAVQESPYTDDAKWWLEKKERKEFGKDAQESQPLQVNVVIGLPQLPHNPLHNGTEPDNQPRLLDPDAV